MIKKIFNLLFNNNYKDNFYFFSYKLQKEFPKGLMLLYEGMSFYIKDYSSSPDFIFDELEENQDKLYIVCEYFDEDIKDFREKYFHEDFFRNRFRVFKELSGE